ncbi:MAG: bifunctional 5,10-methylenetetrahydrofolate dehydrogenase/5,10-methenyltetrahydrofolate cyclohydrolase [Candidatus Omnitrophica bacterium]|nr:bifunctional 5,10-methylenetetrahydrofolate dehydrogenase/5,10-methenyltetrahydrofolate cyclohydrolase [Candidatus Omnitrophota bacterium]
MGKVLEAKQIYEELKQTLREKVKLLSPLTIASLRVGKSASCQVYFSKQKKIATDLGINYLPIELEDDATCAECIRKIKDLNKEAAITGIVVNKPFPSHWSEAAVFSAIEVKKDIEGMNPCNLGKLVMGEPLFIPPTVASILEFLKMSEVDLYGKKATVIGFSAIIGKPLSFLLANKFVTVSIAHIATYQKGDLPFYVKNADILISAVGQSQLIKGEWIKEGALVIDAGIAELEGKITGDVEFEQAKKKASFITAVPGGVGKLTSILLFKNLIKAAELTGKRK